MVTRLFIPTLCAVALLATLPGCSGDNKDKNQTTQPTAPTSGTQPGGATQPSQTGRTHVDG